MALEPTEDGPLGAIPARPRAVLLDSFGTLVAMEPPHLRLRELLDLSEDDAARAFRAEISYYIEHHLKGRDDPSLEQLRDECARVLHEALPDDAARAFDRSVVRQAMLDSIRFDAFADSATALQGFRAGGLRVVVASNWDSSLPEVLARARLLHLTDGVMSSAMAGAAKPDAALFEAALELAGCDASEALHVGDSLENDVAGAMAVGIAPVLLARDGPGDTRVPRGVPVVRSLVELVGALAAGGRMLRGG
jgi:putative hydrolase of the HAD superfamily